MSTELNGAGNVSNHWKDDVLGRERLAAFLTTSISEQARLRMNSHGAGLTIALDSDWGTGKSFFVRHWATDLQNQGHPVVVFDAWENDIGDEAAVALMASINAELDKWTKKLSNKEKVKNKAKEATRSALNGLRKAIIPTAKVVAASVVKKATGIAVEEIFEACSKASDNPSELIFDSVSSTLDSGLDEIFKRSLDEHKKRGEAINIFKDSITQLIELLESEAQASTPVFVFVDEVDRCRPTYAIKLLEEIKHIFGVPKICFVVSTNLDQLRESVCAIYGSGFDGHRYLKRFFDHQYTLPEPNNENFAAQLLNQNSPIGSTRAVSGLPNSPTASSTKRSIATIANAFGLDLRSQKQVFDVANSVAAVIQMDKKIFVLWLFFLCALQHKKPHLLKELMNNNLSTGDFKMLCQKALQKDIEIEHQEFRAPRSTLRSTRLSEVLSLYYELSIGDLIQHRERIFGHNTHTYPSSNLSELVNEVPNPFNSNEKYPPSISNYAEWVMYAGLDSQ